MRHSQNHDMPKPGLKTKQNSTVQFEIEFILQYQLAHLTSGYRGFDVSVRLRACYRSFCVCRVLVCFGVRYALEMLCSLFCYVCSPFQIFHFSFIIVANNRRRLSRYRYGSRLRIGRHDAWPCYPLVGLRIW
jgi:hypothetical protein